jgi:hypothetical protein
MTYRAQYRAAARAFARASSRRVSAPPHHLSRHIAEAQAHREGLSTCEYHERLRSIETTRRDKDR